LLSTFLKAKIVIITLRCAGARQNRHATRQMPDDKKIFPLSNEQRTFLLYSLSTGTSTRIGS
jgi:hypothetical protein